MSDQVTLVTSFFDVRTLEGKPSAFEKYFQYGSILMQWPMNFIIFTESRFVKSISDLRSRLGFKDQTCIYPMEIYQSSYMCFLPKLCDHHSKGKLPEKMRENLTKNSPLYHWCMYSKFECLQKAIDLNIFNSQFFFWIDFGIYHIAKPPFLSLEHLFAQLKHSIIQEGKIWCRSLHVRQYSDRKIHYAVCTQKIAGGFFGGLKNDISWLIVQFKQEIDYSLEDLSALDESILGYLTFLYPNRFAISEDFHDGHANLFRIPRGLPTVKEFLVDKKINSEMYCFSETAHKEEDKKQGIMRQDNVFFPRGNTFLLPIDQTELSGSHIKYTEALILWCKENFADKKKRLIDIGAGYGEFSIPLADHFLHVDAYEVDKFTYYALCGSVVLSNKKNVSCHNVDFRESKKTEEVIGLIHIECQNQDVDRIISGLSETISVIEFPPIVCSYIKNDDKEKMSNMLEDVGYQIFQMNNNTFLANEHK